MGSKLSRSLSVLVLASAALVGCNNTPRVPEGQVLKGNPTSTGVQPNAQNNRGPGAITDPRFPSPPPAGSLTTAGTGQQGFNTIGQQPIGAAPERFPTLPNNQVGVQQPFGSGPIQPPPPTFSNTNNGFGSSRVTQPGGFDTTPGNINVPKPSAFPPRP